MRPRSLFWLGSALLLAACDDQIVSPVVPEEAPVEGPKLTFGTPQYDGANAAAVDENGFVYVAGRTDGSLDGPHRGMADFFVRKYHPEGDVLWADQFGTHLHDEATGVAVDRSGNVYVVGRTEGSLAGSRGGFDAFMRKYDTNGLLQWTRQFGWGLSGAHEFATGVAVNPDGSAVYVSANSTASGESDALVFKYSSDGDSIWTRVTSTPGGDYATGIAADALGNVYVVGYTAGDLGPCCIPQGGNDAFIKKYDPNGLVWTRQFGTIGDDRAHAVAVDPFGNAILAGATLDPSRWGVSWDAFVRKYDGNGQLLFASTFGSSSDDQATAITVDDAGSYYVTGVTSGLLMAGHGKANAGGSDVFLYKYDVSDKLIWTTQFGTSADDRASGIASLSLDPAQGPRIFIAGSTAGTLVGKNRGKYDAYLRCLGHLGSTIWTDQ
ncbi:MAG TPA: SBBP repeat-containing protein [Gemmatimonadaceae bacterium]|nr:SBBP repeat-containing protein [Gemmatimonadaceae bacterium]